MPPRFLYPLLPFRSFLHPILVVCAVGLPCWLVFRLSRRRTPGQRTSLGRELLLLTFVVYLLALAAVTLSPNRGAVAQASAGIELRPNTTSLTCSFATAPRSSSARGFCQHNAGGNVALFFPLGFLLPLVVRDLRFRRAMLIAIGLSISIEILQYFSRAWGSYRTADVNDVILNTVGAFLGLAVVSLLRFRPTARPAVARAERR
jgi:glycopeptide antibiotics resistance protein